MTTMTTDPSARRSRILDFIRQRIAAGQPPSLAEIAAAFGFASRNAAYKHVQALAEAGLIELAPPRSAASACRPPAAPT